MGFTNKGGRRKAEGGRGIGDWGSGIGNALSPLPSPLSPSNPQAQTPNIQDPSPKSKITSHSPLATRHFSLGFTLVEMLVVITIVLLLVTAAATMMRPDVEGRRIREAARSINVYLSTARNRAMETGRPCGVIFRNFGSPGFAMTADQCEVPPCYCGSLEQSHARLSLVTAGGTNVNVYFLDSSGNPESLSPNMVRPADIIQFNCQGPLYKISPGTVDANGYFSGTSSIVVSPVDVSQVQKLPWPTTPDQSGAVSYRIYRSPVKGAAEPLQLPAASVVDLYASGVGAAYNGSTTASVTVLFSPNGSVAGVSGIPVTEPIFLLVGKRGRMSNDTATYVQNNANETAFTNYQDLGNLWIVINPQTGLVTSEPVAVNSSATSEANAIIAARSLAKQTQGMGGK
jgi:prepilin-type N-terminal cleavage/methylation domain-containing protein